MFEITSNTGSYNMKKVNNAVSYCLIIPEAYISIAVKNLEVRISGETGPLP